MRIGFFDSGIGGITVLAEALAMLPDEEYLFLADVDHVPYGEKTSEEIAHYARDNARFLLSEGVQAIVVACNTATAVAIRALREMTDIPVIGMEPAVKPAVEALSAGEDRRAARVLVTATPVTLREAKLKDLIDRVDPDHRVDLAPLPGLVPLAEREVFDDPQVDSYLDTALAGIRAQDYSAVVLGCTHFLYFKPAFRRLLGNEIRLIDGNEGTVRRLADVLGLALRSNGSVREPAGSAVLSDTTADTERTGKRSAMEYVTFYQSGRRVEDPETLERYARLLRRAGEMNRYR